MNWPLGSILISRNNNEADNTSPGYWNHCAIWIGLGQLIESQEGYGVITTDLDNWLKRDIAWGAHAPRPQYREAGVIAAARARELVGLPYRKLSSIRRRVVNPNRGVNCVSAAFEIPWGHALNRRFPKVRVPDDVLETKVFLS